MNWWDAAPTVDPLEAAFALEGFDSGRQSLARSVYAQESSSGANAKTSNAGAVGGMQIRPDTFKRFAEKGWDINDPVDNARAALRYMNHLYGLADGDERLVAAGYYGGEGGLQKARAGQGVLDPRNPNAPDTLQYADRVVQREAKSGGNWWESAPVVQDEAPDPDQSGGTTQSRSEAAVPATPESSVIGSIGAGAGKAVGDAVLGAQALLGRGLRAAGLDDVGNWLAQDAATGKARLQAENAPYAAANPVSNIAGQIGGSIAPGAGIASLLGRGLSALGGAAKIGRYIEPLAQAVSSGGFRAGGLTGLSSLGTRAAGGAISGTGIGAVYDPEHIGLAAGLGATIPLAGHAAYAGTRYAGNVGRALIDPFTQVGQQRIAANILNRAAAGGPAGANAAELVPGSIPTLAEATGNPGIAALQRSLRDVNPSPFVEREQANAAARLRAFEEAAGDASKLDFFRAARSATADDLYNKAIDGYTGETTPWIKGQITQLLKRPSITQARKTAQQWAIERGQKPDPAGSLRSMHDMKTALDDMIGKAVRDGEGGRAKALQQTKDQLVTVMEKMSPEYATARQTYAAMSEPVNAMEALQGLKLTDQYGNLTLAKVQNAIRSLQDRIARPGVDAAKSVSSDQLGVLMSIRDDLLRGANINLGRSLGSNTAQNLVTQNMMTQMLPGRLGDLVGRASASGMGSALGSGLGFLAGGPTGAVAGGVAGSAAGKIGSSLLNGQNDAVQRALTGLLLNSQTGLSALQGAARPAAPFAQITPLQRLFYPSVTASAVNGLARLGSPASTVHGR